MAVQLEEARSLASDSQARAVQLDAVVRSREAQLENVGTQAAKSMDEIATLRGALDASESRNREHERAAKEAASALAEERKKLKAKEKELAATGKLGERVGALEKELAERETRIADILAEGEALSRKVGEKDVALKAVREKLRAAEADRDEKKEDLEEGECTQETKTLWIRIY